MRWPRVPNSAFSSTLAWDGDRTRMVRAWDASSAPVAAGTRGRGIDRTGESPSVWVHQAAQERSLPGLVRWAGWGPAQRAIDLPGEAGRGGVARGRATANRIRHLGLTGRAQGGRDVEGRHVRRIRRD